MKNKLAVFSSFAFLCLLATVVGAAPGVRGPKVSTTITGNTALIGISSSTAIVYSVVLGTGTAGTDFTVLFDSSNITGLAVGAQSTVAAYKTRINVSSTTQNTVVTFDPPLQFLNGIMAANSAATSTSMIIWEPGRDPQGN